MRQRQRRIESENGRVTGRTLMEAGTGWLGCLGATVGRLCLCYVVSGHRHHNGSAFVDLPGLCAGEFTRFDQQLANAHHSLVDA